MKDIFDLLEDYSVVIVLVFDIGVVEMCMWLMFGQCVVDVFVWESFGKDWVIDVVNEFKLDDCNIYVGDFGVLLLFDEV